jgi:hypothetical protein
MGGSGSIEALLTALSAYQETRKHEKLQIGDLLPSLALEGYQLAASTNGHAAARARGVVMAKPAATRSAMQCVIVDASNGRQFLCLEDFARHAGIGVGQGTGSGQDHGAVVSVVVPSDRTAQEELFPLDGLLQVLQGIKALDQVGSFVRAADLCDQLFPSNLNTIRCIEQSVPLS